MPQIMKTFKTFRGRSLEWWKKRASEKNTLAPVIGVIMLSPPDVISRELIGMIPVQHNQSNKTDNVNS